MSQRDGEDGRRLRVAVVAKSVIPTGGMECYAFETIRFLLKRGHEVDVLARRFDGNALPGVRWIRLPDRCGWSSVASAAELALASARILAARSYDVVHSHERTAGQDLLTFHCFTYRGSLARYGRLRRIDQTFLSPRSWIYLGLERRQALSPMVAAVSEAVRADLLAQYPGSKVTVIPPGVDLARFSPERRLVLRDEARRAFGYTSEDLVLLFVGSEFRRKGLDRIFPLLHGNLRLLVAGQGDQRERHERLAERTGGRVRFAGLVADVMGCYAAADAVLLPSRSEAFGMSILEGMACGLPVAVSANAGIASILTPGRNGFLWDEASAAAMLSGLADPVVRATVGDGARKTAEGFAWERVGQRYEELYLHRAAEKKRLRAA